MTIEIIRCLQDNYAYLVHDAGTQNTTLIDAPEAAPILDTLRKNGLGLTRILLTHHHWDHVDGLAEILDATGQNGARVPVWGAQADAHRLPALDHTFAPGETLPGNVQVLDAPGHTIGHVAFYMPDHNALFSADSLMTHGCGRLFEGTPDQMFDTIAQFAQLPDDTRVFCGHDYAQANLDFAAQFAPDPAALVERQAQLAECRATSTPTTGTTLASEKRLNPYLRCHLPQVATAAGLPNSTPRAVLAEIRKQKDNA